jgi:hypothetical protein
MKLPQFRSLSRTKPTRSRSGRYSYVLLRQCFSILLVVLARNNARNSGCSCYAGIGAFVGLEADYAWSKSETA